MCFKKEKKEDEKRRKKKKREEKRKKQMISSNMFSIESQIQAIPLAQNPREKKKKQN